MLLDWLTVPWQSVARIVFSAVALFIWLVIAVRITGLRTFSKMASVDFAVTVATGTVVASTVTSTSTTVGEGAVSLATLLAIQVVFSLLRRRRRIALAIENQPTVLMAGTEFLHDNLRRTRVTVDDVRSKLREANVLQYSHVRAVVLETTGDISVLHGSEPVEGHLLEGVHDGDRVERSETR